MVVADDAPRVFSDDAAIRRIGEGLLDRTLPRQEFTHEAHVAATLWILLERPDVVLERDIRAIISGFNVAVGGVNDETSGYHHTLSLAFVAGVRAFAARATKGSLRDHVHALLSAPEGQRSYPLRFWTRDRLFSREARLGWVEPDLATLPAVVPTPPT